VFQGLQLPLRMVRKASKRRLLASILVLLALIVSARLAGSRDRTGKGKMGVAILDPLADDEDGFTPKGVELFESAGYEVDVFSGDEVSVGHIKKISGEYRIVVFRVHSSINHGRVWFFTGERYAQGRYVLEQLLDEVHPARPALGSDFLFAVGADFVLHFLEDRFDGTLIVVMGCDGLKSYDLAKAFLDVGAAAYVSWDGPVSLEHTDEATLAMLKGLVAEGMCLEDAVRYSMELVGPDPFYSSLLCYFPEEGKSLSIK
jgi:hypothetical protein